MKKMLEIKEMTLEDEHAFCEFEKKYKKACQGEKIPYSLNPKNLDYKIFFQELENCKYKETVPEGFVLARYYLILVDGNIVGGINLRMETNDFILNYAGHIGYGIAPWERNKGYAKSALKKLLVLAKEMGMSDFLLTVDEDNIFSQKVIISCGGKLEKTQNQKYFYWIHLGEWKKEESVMAIVFCKEKLLATRELIYGKEVLSCPKGHIEIEESHMDTAIRECYEETGVIINKDDYLLECESFFVKF